MQTRQRDLNTALILCHVCVARATRRNRRRDGRTRLKHYRNTVCRKELSTRYSVDNIGDRDSSTPLKMSLRNLNTAVMPKRKVIFFIYNHKLMIFL